MRRSLIIWTQSRLAWLLGSLAAIISGLPLLNAQTFEQLYVFNPPAVLEAGLIEGSDGDFYGTTVEGGLWNRGTVFKVTLGGTLTTLVEFSKPNGMWPYADLIQGRDGNFYGTTEIGGGSGYGDGTVFQITPGGTLTTLAIFNGTNGSGPDGGLLQGSDGNFYGTTVSGGAGREDASPVTGYGTVFQMTPVGLLKTLVSFNRTNGAYPRATLVQGIDGRFYGTTVQGGSHDMGTVFKITPTATLTTLVSFNGANGSEPEAGLVLASDGNFYGTTFVGGATHRQGTSSGNGTVFRMTPTGVLTTLVSFAGSNGRFPKAGLVQGSDGNFYGSTVNGGKSDFGTVFKMTHTGMLTTMVSLNGTNGSYPYGRLVQGRDGNLYGTASGTIFRLVQPIAIKATLSGNGDLALTWNTITGSAYQVEYKSSLRESNWTLMTADLKATNPTTSITDHPANTAERYYRVRLLP